MSLDDEGVEPLPLRKLPGVCFCVMHVITKQPCLLPPEIRPGIRLYAIVSVPLYTSEERFFAFLQKRSCAPRRRFSLPAQCCPARRQCFMSSAFSSAYATNLSPLET